MAVIAGSVYVDINGRTISFDRAMRRAERKLRSFEQQAVRGSRNASAAFGGLTNSVKGAMGAMVGFASVAGAFMAVRGAIVVYNNFATSMNNVKAVSGATATQFSLLNEKAQELGATTRFTAGQVAESMSFMSMAGLNVDQVYQGVEHTLNLAAAANLDLGQSADIVTNIMTAMQLEVKDLGRATDVLVKTFTSSNTKLNDLGYAFKFVAPAASAAGISLEETSAALGLLGNAGMQGTLAGTALRVALIRLQNPTKEAQKAMAKYGINLFDAQGKLKNLIGILKEFEPHMKDTKLLADVFGVRGYIGMVNLLNAGSDELARFTNELKEAQETSKRIAKTQMEGLPGALKRLEAAVESVSIALGESRLGKMLTLFIDDLTRAAQATTLFINSLAPLGQRSLATVRSQRQNLELEYIKLGDTIEGLQKRAEANKGTLTGWAEGFFTPGSIETLRTQREELNTEIKNLREVEQALVRLQNKALKPIKPKKKKKVFVDPDDIPQPSFGGDAEALSRAKALASLRSLEFAYLQTTKQNRKLIELEAKRELEKFQAMLDQKLISQEQFETARRQLATVTAKRLEELRQEEMKFFNDIASSVSGALESAFRNFVEEGKLDFHELTKSILADIAVITLRMAVLGPLFGRAGGGTGQGILGNVISGVTGGAANDNQSGGLIGGLLSRIFHDGGKVGQSHGVVRTVPAATFIGAPKLHNGGKILKDGEVPSILKRGEVVINPDKQAPKQKTTERPINITMNISTPDVESFRKSRSQIGAELMRVVESGRRGA